MTDKKNSLGSIELKPVKLDKDIQDAVFPTRVPELCETLAVVIDDVIKCYLCMDVLQGMILLHVHIPTEYRHTKDILELKEVFYSHVHPWCKNKGASVILVSTLLSDKKTIGLFKTFDFKPEEISMAIMPVKT